MNTQDRAHNYISAPGQMKKALHQVPLNRKTAYLEALQVCPELVQAESPHLLFLQNAENNPDDAAKKLAGYWEFRRTLFGERAFRSVLDLSGNGALSKEETRILALGLAVLLPNDTSGRSVVLIDQTQSTAEMQYIAENVKLRCLFWVMQAALVNNKGIPSNEMVGIMILDCLNQNFLKSDHMQQLMETIMPIKLTDMHAFIVCTELNDQQHCAKWPCAKTAPIPEAFKPPWSILNVHATNDVPEIRQVLASRGILNAPPRCGGAWSYENDFLRTLKEHGYSSNHNGKQLLATASTKHKGEEHGIASPAKRTRLSASPNEDIEKEKALIHDVLAQYSSEHSGVSTNEKRQPVGSRERKRTAEESDSPNHFSRRKRAGPEEQFQNERTELHVETTDVEVDSVELESTVVETTQMQTTALCAYYSAIRESTEEGKSAYLEACERCPELFASDCECDPLRPLRCERFQAIAAARRMINHWKWRKLLFGERAFLPLTQTGNGALSPEDIAVLKTGYMMIMYEDSRGPFVLNIDPTLLEANTPPASRLRVYFYMCSVMSNSPRAQTLGYRFLSTASPSIRDQYRGTRRQVDKIAEEGSFSLLDSCHLVCWPELGETKSFFEKIWTGVMKTLGNFIGGRYRIYMAKSLTDVANQLKSNHFSKRLLPEKLGGCWGKESFDKWIKVQCAKDTKYEMSIKRNKHPSRPFEMIHLEQKANDSKVNEPVG